MAHPSGPNARGIERHPQSIERRDPLRIVICGSVGDGKSTLIVKLLQASNAGSGDPLPVPGAGAGSLGAQREGLDFTLLPDGLIANLDQTMATAVEYCSFSTVRRHFIFANAPGSEQHARSMVAATSTAQVAVILVDACKGVLAQTHWHSCLCALLGVRKVVLAVNKLDVVGHSREVFERVEAEYRTFSSLLGFDEVVCIPLSALQGDNVTAPGSGMGWYHGPTLMGFLETVDVADREASGPFRMAVQRIDRPSPDTRGFSGRIAGGSVRSGDRIRTLPSGKESTVGRILSKGRDVQSGTAGQQVTLTLADEIDIGPGDVIAAAGAPPGIADQFDATLVWFGEEEMLPGRSYLLRSGEKTVGATVATLKHKLNVGTLEHLAARTLQFNEIGRCNLSLDQSIPFDPCEQNRNTGSFVLIDRLTNIAVGAGTLHFALRRSQNIHWQAIEVNKEAHARLNGHGPCVIWFTGLSGSGKSTIANVLEKKLHGMGHHTYLLDGDNVRHGLNKDLGFTEADRVENIRRVAEVAKLMVDAGLVVLVSFISPFRAERRFARELLQSGEFCEVFVDTPLELAESRDRKGLYRKARRGELKNFTGIDSPYEAPEHAEVTIATASTPPEAAAEAILSYLRDNRILGAR